MVRKHNRKGSEIVNALDFPMLPIIPQFSENPPKDEISSDIESSSFPEKPDHVGSPQLGNLADSLLWEAIKDCLTAREFEAFDLKFRYLYRQTEISKVMGVSDKTVSILISKAISKLRGFFSRKSKKKGKKFR